MPTAEFQEVKFKISVDADAEVLDKLSKTLKKLGKININAAKLEKLITTLERLSNIKTSEFSKSMNDMAQGMKTIVNASSKLDSKGVTKLKNAFSSLNFGDLSKSIEKLDATIANLASTINSLDAEKLKSLSGTKISSGSSGGLDLSQAKQVRSPNFDSGVSTSNSSSTLFDASIGDNLQMVGMMQDAFNHTLEQSKSTSDKMAESLIGCFKTSTHFWWTLSKAAFDKIKAFVSPVTDKIGKSFSSAMGKATKQMSKGMKDLFSKKTLGNIGRFMTMPATSAFKKVGAGVTSLGKKFTGLFARIGNMALYRMVRSGMRMVTEGLKEGVDNLYNWSSLSGGTFMQSMDKMATSMQYLKNSIGAAAAPLLEALAPALDLIVDKVVEVINWFNQLISSLTGKSTFYQAMKAPAKYSDEYDKAMEKSKKSTKKAADEQKRWVLGFDELNKLGSDKDNKSSDNDAAKEFADKYGPMFKEMKVANDISDLAKQIKDAINKQDWKGLGTLLGNKVNEVFNKVDFKGAGKKLADGCNGVIQTLYWTLKTIDFTNIGSKLADFVNMFLNTFDFEYLGRLMVRGLTSIFDLIIGFFTTLDFGAVATGISNFILGIYRELNEWIEKIDWYNLGTTIYNQIKDFLLNIKWDEICSEMFRLLGNALRAAIQLLAGIFSGLGADIAKWWNESIKDDTFAGTCANLWNAILKGLGNIGEWVMKNIIDPFMGALIGEENWKDAKEKIKQTWEDIKKGWEDFWKFIGQVWDGIAKPVKDFWNWIFGGNSSETKDITVDANFRGRSSSPLVQGLVDNPSYQPNVTVGVDSKNLSSSPLASSMYNGNTYNGNVTANVNDKLNSSNQRMKDMYNTGNTSVAMNAGINTTNQASTHVQRELIDSGHTNGEMTVGMPTVNHGSTGPMSDLLNTGNTNGSLSTSVTTTNNASSGPMSDLLSSGNTYGSVDAEVNLRKGNYRSITEFVTGTAEGILELTVDIIKGNTPGKAKGGAFYGGSWHDIPQYANGTLNAGSMFVAGERGPELVGHVGSRTEVLNQSQLAATMYASVQRAMKSISSSSVNPNTSGIENALTEIVGLMKALVGKDNTTVITTGDIDRAKSRKNVREGVVI